MGLVNVFSAGARDIHDEECRLREMENMVFRLVAGEERDLAIHVRQDIPRFETLNLRQRLSELKSASAANRNLTVTAAGLVVIGAKVFGLLDPLLKLIGAL